MSDIVEYAQKCAAHWRSAAQQAAVAGRRAPSLDMLSVAGTVEGLLSEIARLRLTDAEREAIAWLTKGESPFPEEEQRMATLRAFLERHAKGGGA